MKDKFEVKIIMEDEMCHDCKKKNELYFELKVQIRFRYFKDKEEIFEKLVNKFKGDMIEKINKFEELDNGFDIYFRSLCQNKILGLFNKDFLYDEKRSKTVVGRDLQTCKDKCRHFQLITILNLTRGDIVEIKGKEYTIKALNNNDLVLINNKNSDKEVLKYKTIRDYLRLIKKGNGEVWEE